MTAALPAILDMSREKGKSCQNEELKFGQVTLRNCESVFGNDHYATGVSRLNLAGTLFFQEKYDSAMRLLLKEYNIILKQIRSKCRKCQPSPENVALLQSCWMISLVVSKAVARDDPHMKTTLELLAQRSALQALRVRESMCIHQMRALKYVLGEDIETLSTSENHALVLVWRFRFSMRDRESRLQSLKKQLSTDPKQRMWSRYLEANLYNLNVHDARHLDHECTNTNLLIYDYYSLDTRWLKDLHRATAIYSELIDDCEPWKLKMGSPKEAALYMELLEKAAKCDLSLQNLDLAITLFEKLLQVYRLRTFEQPYNGMAEVEVKNTIVDL
jgi:hypothetical protein